MRWLIVVLVLFSCQKEKEVSKLDKKEVKILIQSLVGI